MLYHIRTMTMGSPSSALSERGSHFYNGNAMLSTSLAIELAFYKNPTGQNIFGFDGHQVGFAE